MTVSFCGPRTVVIVSAAPWTSFCGPRAVVIVSAAPWTPLRPWVHPVSVHVRVVGLSEAVSAAVQ